MENELFERMPVPKAYFRMALPVVTGMVVNLVYNLVDTWFIARTQDTALVAGVSLCAPVVSLMVAFGDIFGLGGANLISRLLGKKETDSARGVSAFSIWCSILFGLLVTAVMLLFRVPVLTMLGAAADTFDYASSYYTWIVIGAAAMIFNIVPNNLLRTEGLAREAMVCTVAGAVINIGLDPIFIFALNLGAAGAAIATVLSNVISDVMLVCTILRKAKVLSAAPRDARIDGAMLREILTIGIPASITNLMASFATLLLNRSLVAYGTGEVAAYGIAMKINLVCLLICVGFAFGAQPLLGYNYGAGNRERLRDIIRFDVLVELVTGAVFLLAAFIAAPALIRFFLTDPDVVSAGSTILKFVMSSAPAVGIILVATTLFQAEGKALPAFILSVSRQGVILAVTVAVLPAIAGHTGVLAAQPAADLITLALALLLLRRKSA